MFLFLLACAGGPSSPAGEVTFDATRSGTSAQTVQGALDELYVRCSSRTEAAVAPTSGADAGLAARIQTLELAVERLEKEGISAADRISYDPRDTTLKARTVQESVTELEGRLQVLEDGGRDMGEPGPALFELRDKHGNLVDDKSGPGGAPGGMGPPGAGGAAGKAPAGKGPPNGGAPNGGPQGPRQPNQQGQGGGGK